MPALRFFPLRHGLLLGKYDDPQEFEEGDFRSNVDGFKESKVLEGGKSELEKLSEPTGAGPGLIRAPTGFFWRMHRMPAPSSGCEAQDRLEVAALAGWKHFQRKMQNGFATCTPIARADGSRCPIEWQCRMVDLNPCTAFSRPGRT